MRMYEARLTSWTTKDAESRQKYKQTRDEALKYKQTRNEAFTSFAEEQAWLCNYCAASFEYSDKATIQAYEPAAFASELQKVDSTLTLDDLRITLIPC